MTGDQIAATGAPIKCENDSNQGTNRARVIRPYSPGEEIANAVTHGLGTVLSVAGLTMMVTLAALQGGGRQVAAAIVYGISLIALYTASTLYHAVRDVRLKKLLKTVDHASIYLLIAGTYTPFTLITLQGNGGWLIFGLVWGIAVLGLMLEVFWPNRPKAVSLAGYIGMGWIIIFKAGSMVETLSAPGLWLLLGGGLSYTIGTVFYVMKRTPYMHSIWHLFVLGGSICHFLAVVMYVM